MEADTGSSVVLNAAVLLVLSSSCLTNAAAASLATLHYIDY